MTNSWHWTNSSPPIHCNVGTKELNHSTIKYKKTWSLELLQDLAPPRVPAPLTCSLGVKRHHSVKDSATCVENKRIGLGLRAQVRTSLEEPSQVEDMQLPASTNQHRGRNQTGWDQISTRRVIPSSSTGDWWLVKINVSLETFFSKSYLKGIWDKPQLQCECVSWTNDARSLS